jgi:hypothetical protein
MGQDWHFHLEIAVEPGEITGKIVIESLLHKTGTTTISVPNVLKGPSAFHAYFVHGSAVEFSVSPSHGFIEPNIMAPSIELPLTVVFAPLMYGKVLKGLLAIDTIECQFIFEVLGKTPDYIPPVIASGTAPSRLDNILPAEDIQKMQPKKRNVIKDNIEGAKIARPVPTPQKRK